MSAKLTVVTTTTTIIDCQSRATNARRTSYWFGDGVRPI
jgi:hypothetical protein